MYVPGKLANTKSVIIDIGTKYYAEKVLLIWMFNIALPTEVYF